MRRTLAVLLLLLNLFLELEGSESGSLVFGVRWFLGETFQLHPPMPVQQQTEKCDLMAMFNTYDHLPNHTFTLKVDAILYPCSVNLLSVNITETHHPNFNDWGSVPGSMFETYVYRCAVRFSNQEYLSLHASLTYSIISDVGNETNEVYKGNLRSPKPQGKTSEVVIFGDWGVITNFSKIYQLLSPITECLLEQIAARPEARLLIILGDLAYDLQGETYIHFFEHSQAVTSQMAMILTPGNHETTKHKDLFTIVQQSFYSPYWSRFYGYYDLFSIGQFVFMGYNVENLFPWLGPTSLFKQNLSSQYNTHEELVQKQLSQTIKQRMKESFLIGFSHYPIYCSEEDEHESSAKYLRLQSNNLRLLNDLQVDLYFSGHLHIYERTKPICGPDQYAKPLFQNDTTKVYETGCPIFVIEGAGGNNYYVETDRHFDLKSQSDRFIDNTGFGILTLHHQAKDKEEVVLFEHVSVPANCSSLDIVSLVPPSLKIQDQTQLRTEQSSKNVFASLQFYLIALISLILILVFIKIRRKSTVPLLNEQPKPSRSHQNVLELAQQQSAH